jgi:hypothetical protein
MVCVKREAVGVLGGCVGEGGVGFLREGGDLRELLAAKLVEVFLEGAFVLGQRVLAWRMFLTLQYTRRWCAKSKGKDNSFNAEGAKERRKGRKEGGWVVRWNDGRWEQSEEAGWLAG